MKQENTPGVPVERGEVLSEAEQRERITRWTIPFVELDDLVQLAEGRVALPLEREKWVAPLAQVSRVRADSQNEEGIRLGYYPEGFIHKRGTYIYSPPTELKVSKRRYKPTLLQSPETALLDLFPKSELLMEFAQLVLQHGGQPVVEKNVKDSDEAWALAEVWSDVGNGFFTDPLLNGEGERRIETHYGWPVAVFQNPRDLERLQPYAAYQVPENTQAVSFVATPVMEPPRSGEIIENTPFIACLEGCPPEVIEQHIRTQLMFAQAMDREVVTPILVSREQANLNLEEHLEMKIKERVLALYIAQKGAVPTNWHSTDQTRQAITAAQQELFTQKRRKSPVKRPLYIGDRTDLLDAGPNYEERIKEWVGKQMQAAFELIDLETVEPDESVSLSSRARELCLVRVNYFSFFLLSQWPEAAELYNQWEGRHDFRKSFKIPREILAGSQENTGGEEVEDQETFDFVSPAPDPSLSNPE